MTCVLYLLHKSPYSNFSNFENLVKIVKSQLSNNKVGVALIQDVVVSLKGKLHEAFRNLVADGVEVIALKEDLDARGIVPNVKDCRCVTYRELINLIMNEYDMLISW